MGKGEGFQESVLQGVAMSVPSTMNKTTSSQGPLGVSMFLVWIPYRSDFVTPCILHPWHIKIPKVKVKAHTSQRPKRMELIPVSLTWPGTLAWFWTRTLDFSWDESGDDSGSYILVMKKAIYRHYWGGRYIIGRREKSGRKCREEGETDMLGVGRYWWKGNFMAFL